MQHLAIVVTSVASPRITAAREIIGVSNRANFVRAVAVRIHSDRSSDKLSTSSFDATESVTVAVANARRFVGESYGAVTAVAISNDAFAVDSSRSASAICRECDGGKGHDGVEEFEVHVATQC